MNYVNPLTFFNNSSIIDYGSINNAQKATPDEAKNQFLKMLLEKIYLKDFKMTFDVNSDEEKEGDTVFNNEVSNMVVNEMFRGQLAQQMLESNMFDMNLGDIK